MLSEDPAARPTTAAMLEHPWLRDQGVAPDAPLGSIVVDRLRNFAAMTRLKKARKRPSWGARAISPLHTGLFHPGVPSSPPRARGRWEGGQSRVCGRGRSG